MRIIVKRWNFARLMRLLTIGALFHAIISAQGNEAAPGGPEQQMPREAINLDDFVHVEDEASKAAATRATQAVAKMYKAGLDPRLPYSPQDIIDIQFYHAARHGNLEIFCALAASGANLRYIYDCKKAVDGRAAIKTPLLAACSRGQADIVSWYLENCKEALSDKSAHMDYSAIHFACAIKGTPEVVELLVEEAGADVNEVARWGYTPAFVAVVSSNFPVLKYLVSKGADLFHLADGASTLLCLAVFSRHHEMLRWLIDQGLSSNQPNETGSTPLHLAVRFGDLEAVKVLVEHGGADVKAVDGNGATALEEADRTHVAEIARFLWLKGSDPTMIKHSKGLGPIAWFRVRHENMPAAHYSASCEYMNGKLVIFSGLGCESGYVHHDSDHTTPDNMRFVLHATTYVADLDAMKTTSMVPEGAILTRSKMRLDAEKMGHFVRLDPDGLGGWSLPCPAGNENAASSVRATEPFKRSEKFGYFEVLVLNAGDARCTSIGLVDGKYPLNRRHPGWDKDSYGLHGDDGTVFHNTGAGWSWTDRFHPGDVIGVGINYTGVGEVFWTKNGHFLGVSHIAPQSDAYWPLICVQNAGAIFKVNFGLHPFLFSFSVPTLSWSRTLPQPRFHTVGSRLIAIPELNLLWCLPNTDQDQAAVWLFDMHNYQWRRYLSHGVPPMCTPGVTQPVRAGNAIYVWTPLDSAVTNAIHRRTIHKFDLTTGSWMELLSYNILADPTVDDRTLARLPPPGSLPNGTDLQAEPFEIDAMATENLNSDGSEKDEEHRLSPKEIIAARLTAVSKLLNSEFEESVCCGIGDELIFVTGLRMLRFNPKTFAYKTVDLRGKRPTIWKQTFFTAGTHILVFGGVDHRREQNELFALDTCSNLWYKPHIDGYSIPRPRYYLPCAYFERQTPLCPLESAGNEELVHLVPHTSCMPPPSPSLSPLKSRLTVSHTSSYVELEKRKQNELARQHQNALVYRYFMVGMGWKRNIAMDIDFAALDTQKVEDELGGMLDPNIDKLIGEQQPSSRDHSPGSLEFDVSLRVRGKDDAVEVIQAHRAILWARSSFFRTWFSALERLPSDASAGSNMTTIDLEDISPTHAAALIKYLYSDRIDVEPLHAGYREFIRGVEKYAPNHSARLIGEYLHTKTFERSRMHEDLEQLLTSGAFSDVTLRVEGCLFKAHKIVLASRSAFFKALLTGGLKESTQEVIDFEAPAASFRALLTFFYTRDLDYSSISDYILDLFSLATRIEAVKLKTTLESLIAFNLDESNVASLLLLADHLLAPSLKLECQRYITANPEKIQYEDEAQRKAVAAVLR